MTHKTKGIVLRTVKYGETSVITTVYTELFGVQSYIVKGIRQSSKKAQGKAQFFQPAAILDLVVYHNEFKNLNFIKEYQWGFLYQQVLSNVVKNTVATYVMEVVQHCLKEPEANPELFFMLEDTLKQLDKGNSTLTGNLPLYFTLHLTAELGFRIQGEYTPQTSILDLQEGQFVEEKPSHPHYLEGKLAETTSVINSINFYNDLEQIQLGRKTRGELLTIYQNYLALHVPNYGVIKTLPILQEILG